MEFWLLLAIFLLLPVAGLVDMIWALSSRERPS